jgi:hypothetical protein
VKDRADKPIGTVNAVKAAKPAKVSRPHPPRPETERIPAVGPDNV